MRIFFGYGYNKRDKWIDTYVIPLISAFGCEGLHGRAVYGGALSEEILKVIRTDDGMIGFTTRRGEPIAPGQLHTHDWVIQELSAAHTQIPPIPWVEVREEGVVPPGVSCKRSTRSGSSVEASGSSLHQKILRQHTNTDGY